ncbi:DUF4340 domain-containing protein [bacterium]|nr:DUF4340 domain-containing protein [bacterium]
MLNKLNSKLLLVVLVVLAVVVAMAVIRNNSNTVSTIPEHVAQIDTNALNHIEIRASESEPYNLVRGAGKWKLQLDGDRKVPIESKLLETAISNLLEAKPMKIVSRKEESFDKYEVDDNLGTKVTFYNGNEPLTSVVIGKIDFNQQTRSMSNYVRLADENEVFSLNAALNFDWNKKPADWRNKTLLQASIAQINKVEAQGTQNFILVKQENGSWLANGLPLDSNAIDVFVNGIANLSSPNFNDEVNAGTVGEPIYTLQVFTETNDVGLYLYNTSGGLVVQSSANAGNYFNVDDNLKAKLFPPVEEAEEVE